MFSAKRNEKRDIPIKAKKNKFNLDLNIEANCGASNEKLNETKPRILIVVR